MAFVFAVEAGQAMGCIGRGVERVRGQWREVCTGGGTGFVGAIGTIAVIVVDSGSGNMEGGVGDTVEGGRIFVELGDWDTSAGEWVRWHWKGGGRARRTVWTNTSWPCRSDSDYGQSGYCWSHFDDGEDDSGAGRQWCRTRR
jgi:hypothetical protein